MIIPLPDLRVKIQEIAGTRFTAAETAEIASSIGFLIDSFPSPKNLAAELNIMSRLSVVLGKLKSPAFTLPALKVAAGLDPASPKPIPPPTPVKTKPASTDDDQDEVQIPIHTFDETSDLIDREHWDKVQKAAAKFDPVKDPNTCRIACQVAGDPQAPCNIPVRADDLKVTSSVCGRIRAWGVYWLCKLAQVGLVPPDCLGDDQWPAVLERVADDQDLPARLIDKFGIAGKTIQQHDYSAEDIADSWKNNMWIIATLESDCRKGSPTVLGVVDDRGVLQAAAEYTVMDFEKPPYLAVHDVATAPWNLIGDEGRANGAGGAILEALVIESRAAACGGRIELTPLGGMARDFYEHMHFEKGGAQLTPEGAEKVLQARANRRPV